MICTVIDIRGDYAYVKYQDTGIVSEVAIALLPFGIDVGDKLKFENYEFERIWNRTRHCEGASPWQSRPIPGAPNWCSETSGDCHVGLRPPRNDVLSFCNFPFPVLY